MLEWPEGISLLAGIEAETCQKLKEQSAIMEYGKKEAIFWEGDRSDRLFFVLEGRVKAYRMSEEGEEKTIHFFGPGEPVGELGGVGRDTYPYNAEAAEKVTAAALGQDKFRKLLEMHPYVAVRLLEVMNRRLRQAYRQIRNLALKDTYSRTASRLFKLARDYGRSSPSGITLDLTLSHSELAHLVGASRETVSRVLSDLVRQRIVSLEQGKIVITDLKGLQSISRL